MSSPLKFILLPFYDLSLDQLYDIMVLRQEVFIVEQDCPYLDADGKDQQAYHLFAYQNERLIAYTRLLDKGISYTDYCSIGRVVNAEAFRGQGVGKSLMQASIDACQTLFGHTPIKISAQVYLRAFYEDLGFKSNDEFYDEDGIPHMGMIKKTT